MNLLRGAMLLVFGFAGGFLAGVWVTVMARVVYLETDPRYQPPSDKEKE